MLKVFRDNLKYFSWVLWIVIAAFILFYIPDFMTPRGNVNTAATVWGEEITYQELQETLRNVEAQLRQAYGDKLPPDFAERRAFDQLVNTKILLREARLLGLEVSDDELSREIMSFPSLQGSDGKFVGQQEYLRRLRGNRVDPAEFEEGLRQELLQRKLQEVLSDNLVISEADLERTFRETTERARIRYLQIPASRFADQVEVTDEEIASHFSEHRDEYRLPERREIAYLVVKLDQIRRTMEIDEGELFSYYQEHEDDFRNEEQVRARHILLTTADRSIDEAKAELTQIKSRIEGGEDFATIAKEVSEDTVSAARGGDLGFFRRGQMTPEFEQAAFDAQPHEIVGPIVTPFGVHLIRVEERREAEVRPFAEVRSQIRATLAARRAPEKIQDAVTTLADELAKIPADQLTLEQLQAKAEASGGEVVFGEPAPISREDSVPELGGRSPQVFDAIFELDKGELSKPVDLPNGDRALIYLEDILAPRDQELEEVRDGIRTEIKSRKQQQMAVNRLDEARQALEGGTTTFADLEAQLGVTAQETAEFGPQGPIQGLGYNAKVARAAFEKEEGDLAGPFDTGSGALLFEVIEKKGWDPTEFAEQKDQLRDRLKQERHQRLLSSIILERRDELRADGELQIFDPGLRTLLGS